MSFKITELESYLGNIEDITLKELLSIWNGEDEPFKKSELKRRIIELLEQRERDTFFTRFILRDFDSWNFVLTDRESSDYYSAGFYN